MVRPRASEYSAAWATMSWDCGPVNSYTLPTWALGLARMIATTSATYRTSTGDVRPGRPAAPRSIEERRRVARAVTRGEPLEVGHEAGLSMVRPPHLRDECRPLVMEVGAL